MTVAYLAARRRPTWLFSQMQRGIGRRCCMMMLSRVGMAVTSVLNNSQLLRHTRGRVPRAGVLHDGIGALGGDDDLDGGGGGGLAVLEPAHAAARAAGVLSSLTAVYWAWADATGACRSHLPASADES